MKPAIYALVGLMIIQTILICIFLVRLEGLFFTC
jgi:hypothetical protein